MNVTIEDTLEAKRLIFHQTLFHYASRGAQLKCAAEEIVLFAKNTQRDKAIQNCSFCVCWESLDFCRRTAHPAARNRLHLLLGILSFNKHHYSPNKRRAKLLSGITQQSCLCDNYVYCILYK